MISIISMQVIFNLDLYEKIGAGIPTIQALLPKEILFVSKHGH